MAKYYKVWVQIEAVDEEAGIYGDSPEVLPDPMGTFDDLEQAMQRVWEINKFFGTHPESSDCRPRDEEEAIQT